MSKLKTNTIMFCATLLGVLQTNAVYSVEPMSESDMGNVLAVSGDVLNIMGATASGNAAGTSVSERQLEARNKQASSAASYIETDSSLEPRANASLTPSNINPQDSVSTYKVSERSNGALGNTTLFYDEKANLNNSSYKDNTLTINQNVQVQRVQIEQARHSTGAAARGDYTFGGIQINGAVSIMQR
ncbi:hypothetical protein [Alkalimarinus alittae]|uniref:Uncharacterized protein n=1 Tax=Alkalimarinus alittae TaxID=2961619 RepID=A0ABY6N455_9ALTE|nr:hypothetical protein [Alkalimarinus alittae]UZE96871.1 hypothetical protein NKI27_03730 [Alkalimarinus alittae]